MALRPILALVALLFAPALAAQRGATDFGAGGLAADQRAEVSIFVFANLVPQAEVPVTRRGDLLGRSNRNGALFVELPPEGQELVISAPGFEPVPLSLSLVPGENLQVIVNLSPGQRARVSIESSNKAAEAGAVAADAAAQEALRGDPGSIAGYIFSADTGEPVAGARVFISGTPLDLRSDEEGRFEVELPPGRYSLSVMHSAHATLTRGDVSIAPEQETSLELELVPAGLELPEFVVLEPYVEGSLASVIEEQRTTANVANVLGAEAISRAGDSNAAAALRRVTGLTLSDGQFIIIRGLSERYSKTLVNGADVPSPDPTRSVIPLDLFPADILASVVVQKTYSVERPGNFGGGSIDLRTIGVPEASFVNVSLSSGWNSQTTLERGLDYSGSSTDYRATDDGLRDFPTPDFEIGETTGIDLPVIYSPFSKKFAPDIGLDVAGGYRTDLGERWELGAIAALSYSQTYDNRPELRQRLVVAGGADESGEVPLRIAESFDIERSLRENSLTGYLGLGVRYGENHSVDGRFIYLQDSEDESEVREGFNAEGQEIRLTTLEWEERNFEALQLEGSHVFPALKNLELNWRYADASASRYAPDTREYSYIRGADDIYRFRLRQNLQGNARFWSDLNDEVENYAASARLPFEWDGFDIAFMAGAERTEKVRDSFIRRYEFQCAARNCRFADLSRPLELILAPPLLEGPDSEGFRFVDQTLAEDTYVARRDVAAEFYAVDMNFADRFRIYAGLRDEVFDQETVTFDRANPIDRVVSLVNTDDKLPAASATWFINEFSQLRVGYSETRSRPEFREVSPAIYTDLRLDLLIRGNEDLVPTEFTNYDIRFEYYFDTTDNISIGVFEKELVNPIELVALGGAAQTITLDNAEGANIRGAEFEVYRNLAALQRWLDWAWLDKWYLSANYTWIDSEIELTPEQQGRLTNATRELQGQSPYVANIQLGYDNPDRGIQATLLYNVAGERIAFVGVQGAPDIFEEPFHQVDFIYSQELIEDLTMKIKLQNLLNDEVEYTQGSEIFRSLTRGREAGIAFTYRF